MALTENWKTATVLYVIALEQFEKVLPTATEAAYDRVSQLVDGARKHRDLARDELEIHVVEHGC